MHESVLDARVFAIGLHEGQMYGAHEYSYHLDQVLAEVIAAGLPLEEQIAAVLHDSREDTEATEAELQKRYGVVVASIVEAVSGFGESRAAKKQNMVSKLWKFPRAINVKLADRYCNMRQCFVDGKREKFQMYYDELPAYQDLFVQAHPYLKAKLAALLDEARNCNFMDSERTA